MRNYRLVFVDEDVILDAMNKKAKKLGKVSYLDVLREGNLSDNMISSARQNYKKYCEREGKVYKEGIVAFTGTAYAALCGVFSFKSETYSLTEEYIEIAWVRKPKKTVQKKSKSSGADSANVERLKKQIDTSLNDMNQKINEVIKQQNAITETLNCLLSQVNNTR